MDPPPPAAPAESASIDERARHEAPPDQTAGARAAALEDAQERQGLTARLGDLARRAPVTCAAATPLQDALAIMARERVGAILVVDSAGRTRGIFTERDLLRRVVLPARPLDTRIDQVMTATPVTLPENASAFDAALAMAAHGIRHLPLTRGEGPDAPVSGLVSERDLFALQRLGMRDVGRAISLAEDAAALARAAADVRALAAAMHAQGVGIRQLTQLIVMQNDRLVTRALALAGRDFDLSGIAWCWIALGSEGRREQTIATDQDNALIFTAESPAAADVARARLLPFAQSANALLARIGFPLCRGEIMAGNPRWCLSADEWRARFDAWLRNPTPAALLGAAIFFDLRGLAGDSGLADDLARWIAHRAPPRRTFLRALARNALATTPPGGLLGMWFEAAGIDLKAQGARPFIDAARVLALAQGLPATATAQRLQLWARTGDAPLAKAAIHAFDVVQSLRLAHQLREASRAGGRGVALDPFDETASNPNRIATASLDALDRRALKEAFRQVRALQERLRLDFTL